MKFGIAAKLASLLALFGVLACGLTGYYAYANSRSLLLQAAERDLLTATQVLGRNLSDNIAESARDVRLLAQIASEQHLAGASHTHLENDLTRLFKSLMAMNPQYLQVRLIGAAGHGLEQVRVERDGERLLPAEQSALQEKGHFPYVFETLRLPPGDVRLSSIAISHELGTHGGSGRPTLRVSSPVSEADGDVYGLVVIDIDFELLFAQLRSDLPQRYRVYLSNRWGDLLIHPQSAHTFGFDQGQRYFLQDEYPAVSTLLQGGTENSLIDHSKDLPRQVAAFVRLTLDDTPPRRIMVLGLGQAQSQVLADSAQLGRRIAQAVLLTSLLAVLLAIIASRATTRSLKSINHSVRQFTEERQCSPLPVQRKDELGELARSVRQMQADLLDQLEALQQSHEAMEHLARHDVLTGLPNRRMFFERLEHALASARRNARLLAVLFVDLDHFKELNDSLGHSQGDHVLQAVANLLRSATRESDTVARLGGDEFVVLLEQLDDPQQVISVLHKLHERFQLPLLIDGHEVQVQASMGVSLFPRDGDDIEALLQHADRAMYAAKAAGRNTYSLGGGMPDHGKYP